MTDSPDGADPLALTSKRRAALRAEAHGLKPTLHIGKEGVTDAARRALDQAFANQTLVKVRVLETAPDPARDTAHALAAASSAVVQVAGRNAVLYRPQTEAAPTLRKKAPKLTPAGRVPSRQADNSKHAGTRGKGGKPGRKAGGKTPTRIGGKGSGTRKTFGRKPTKR